MVTQATIRNGMQKLLLQKFSVEKLCLLAILNPAIWKWTISKVIVQLSLSYFVEEIFTYFPNFWGVVTQATIGNGMQKLLLQKFSVEKFSHSSGCFCLRQRSSFDDALLIVPIFTGFFFDLTDDDDSQSAEMRLTQNNCVLKNVSFKVNF